MSEKDPGTRTGSGTSGGAGDGLVNPQAVGRDETEATIRRDAARGTGADPDEIELTSDRQTGSIDTRLTDSALRERAAEESGSFAPGDLRVEGDEVSVRDDVLRERAARGTPFDPSSFRVTEDGSVEAPDPTERVDVTVFDDNISGDVELVGPNGRRRDLGADAGGDEPFFARIDAPDREGQYRIEVGGETVERFSIGEAGAAVDDPGNLAFGFNGTIIDADRDGAGVTQQEYDPDARRGRASQDEDVVAGAGAADALQSGVEAETLSPLNPIDGGEGDRIAEQVRANQSAPSGNPARRGTEANQQLREELAAGEDFEPSDLDLVYASGGLTARVEPSGREIDPGELTQRARDRGVGDEPDALDRLDGDADRGVSITRTAGEGGVATGGPDPERQLNIQTGDPDRGVGITRGPEGTTVVRPEQTASDVTRTSQQQLDAQRAPAPGDVRASANRFGRRQLQQNSEQFGDVDASFGLGDPNTDEVERFLDETLPGAVRDRVTDPGRDALDGLDGAGTGTSRPVGVPGVGVVGQSSPGALGARFGDDLLGFVDDAARAPGLALEGVETAGYVLGEVDDDSPDDALGGVVGFAAEPEQAERRASQVNTRAVAAGVRAAQFARENPRDVTTEAFAGAALSGAGSSALTRAGRLGRADGADVGTRTADVDTDTPGAVVAEPADNDGILPGISERAPSVSVRRDADAPTVDVDPFLRQQIGAAVRERVPSSAADTTSRDVFGRPMTSEAPLQIQQELQRFRDALPDAGEGDTTSRDVFGRPTASDAGSTPLSERLADALGDTDADTTSRDVFGRPMTTEGGLQIQQELQRARDALPDGAADTTSRDVFGRPMTSEAPLQIRRELQRARDALPDASDTDSRDVFGRPLASDTGSTPLSERAVDALPSGAADTTSRDVFGRPMTVEGGQQIRDEVQRVRDLLPSGAGGTTSRDVFGRPTASDAGSTPLSERVTGVVSGAADTDSRDVFGRPLASDADATPLSERAAEAVRAARETSIYVSPIRPRRRLDVGDGEEDVDLGPFADDDLDELPSFAEAYDLDVDTRRTRGGDGGQEQQAALRMRTEREEPDTTRAPADTGQGDRAGSPLLPPAVPGVNERAADPVRGSLNRLGAAMEPSVTPSGSVDRGTTLSDDTDLTQPLDEGGGLFNRVDVGTGLGQPTTPDTSTRVTTTPDTTTDTTTDQPTRPEQTTDTPTRVRTPERDRPRFPDDDLLDEEDGDPSSAPAFTFDDDVFGSGIVGDPFDVDEEELL